MSLYPGWGGGGRIKLAGWTRKFDTTDTETVTVTFDCERDSVERFGSFRSMDILRLWMATGLDTVATDFYKEVENSSRDMELKRRRTEENIISQVKQKLDANFFVYVAKSNAARGEDSTAATFNIYKFEKETKTMSLEQNDLYEATGQDVLRTLENINQSSAKRKVQANHYGFNDTTGIRRWMVNAGLRLYKRQISEDELASSAFDAVPDNYEIMRNTISIETMRSEFADTLVVAIAGLVVPVDPRGFLKRKYDVRFVKKALRLKKTIHPRLTRGIARDGLVPFPHYLRTYFKNDGICAFASPFPRTLTFAEPVQKRFGVPKRIHFKAGTEYDNFQDAPKNVYANEYDESTGNITKSDKYVKLSGVPLHGHHGAYKASYVIKVNDDEDDIVMKTWHNSESSGTFDDKRAGLKWVSFNDDEDNGPPYVLKCNDDIVVEIELLPFSNLFAPVPLQQSVPMGTQEDTMKWADLHFHSSVVLDNLTIAEQHMDTSDTDSPDLKQGFLIYRIYHRYLGPGTTFESFYSTITDFEESLNGQFVNDALKNPALNVFADEHSLRGILLPEERLTSFFNNANFTYDDENINPDNMLTSFEQFQKLFKLSPEKLRPWFSFMRNVIQKRHFYVTRYKTSRNPVLFLPFDEATETILCDYADVDTVGKEYVKANDYDEVAFCEELYRPAADLAADPEGEYSEDNEQMRTVLQRPNGYASAPQDEPTQKFMEGVKAAAKEKAEEMFKEDNVYELVPLPETPQLRTQERHPDIKLIEFFAPGDNVLDGWAMGGTPMCLGDGLELGVAYLDNLQSEEISDV